MNWTGRVKQCSFVNECVELWFSIIVNLVTEYIKLSLITGQMGSLRV
jgi:hypothetical protein